MPALAAYQRKISSAAAVQRKRCDSIVDLQGADGKISCPERAKRAKLIHHRRKMRQSKKNH
jgi:hypothetical protein